jgi:hypothetical protein
MTICTSGMANATLSTTSSSPRNYKGENPGEVKILKGSPMKVPQSDSDSEGNLDSVTNTSIKGILLARFLRRRFTDGIVLLLFCPHSTTLPPLQRNCCVLSSDVHGPDQHHIVLYDCRQYYTIVRYLQDLAFLSRASG